MALDVNTLVTVNAVNLFLMAIVLSIIMGRRLSPAAACARAALVIHALGWVSFIVTSQLSKHWQDHVPAVLADAYSAVGLWLMPTVSIACTSASFWLLFRALKGWLGPRRGEWLMVAAAVLGPLGYALAFNNYPMRVGWANLLLALQMLIICLATLRPASELGGAWRWVIFTCTLILAGFTVARGVMGAFYTELYPSFSTPHPINVLAMLATNVSLVLVNLAALVAWREEAEAKLRSHAYTDALTGLHNRHDWELRAPAMFDQARRHGTPLSLLALDLDLFKHINDTQGHEAGDKVLALLGETIQKCRRSSDLAARIGGEEFAILLPQTDRVAAELFEQRLRDALQAALLAHPSLKVSYSAGLAILQRGDASLTALMGRADLGLYQAKHLGRGRLQVAD